MATGEIGGTPRHYKAGKAVYGWKCPNCGQEQMGRVEHGCQNCGAGRDAQFKARPNPRKTSTESLHRRPAATTVPVQNAAPTYLDPYPLPVQNLVSASRLVLLEVQPKTNAEVEALLALENAVGKFASVKSRFLPRHQVEQPAMTLAPEPDTWEQPEEAVKLNDQLLDPRTILTLAAALDYFADQVLMIVDPASSEFLSEDHTRALSQRLRQTLPPDLASVLEPATESDNAEETEK